MSKTSWLKDVQAAAIRNQEKRIREYKEKQAEEAEKAKEVVKVKEVVKKTTKKEDK